jgi:NAD(P)-dependent dehydrogenase (short-subunit alcohol dehydrogenase family)
LSVKYRIVALLTDKTAVITGTASGVGRAIAELFSDHGAAVVVADIRSEPREGGEPTHERINDQGGDATFVECDVTSYDDCVTAVEAAEEFGGIDVMVNNAGIVGPQTPLVELDSTSTRRSWTSTSAASSTARKPRPSR